MDICHNGYSHAWMNAFLSVMTSSSNESKLSFFFAYIWLWCLVFLCAHICIFPFHNHGNVTLSAFSDENHGAIENRFCCLQKIHDLLSLFPLYPPTLLPQAMSSTCLMTMWKHVRRYLGNWRTTTWCLPLWFRSTGAGPGLYAVQPSLQSSWTEVMVSKHFLYLSLDWKIQSRLSAGCNLIVPTEKQTLVLLCHRYICNSSFTLDMTSDGKSKWTMGQLPMCNSQCICGKLSDCFSHLHF